jgi:NADH-quinone oxidoreductase subunit C
MSAVENLTDLGERIAGALGGAVTRHEVAFGELTLWVEAAEIETVCAYLRDDKGCLFQTLVDICGADFPEHAQRFEVIYHFLSMRLNQRIRVKTLVDEATSVPSVAAMFRAADWFEREAFDMYGILFSGHPDLRRLLTDYGFSGHPLRKDFPLTGYLEVRYDPDQQRVVYEPVKLQQEFRNFDFLSPWEGGPPPTLPGDEKAGKGA